MPPLHPATRPWLQTSAPLLLAVSGGADSMAMLHLLHAACPGKPLAVAHFNHRLRPTGDDDAQLVAETCDALGVAFHLGHWQRTGPLAGNLPEQARQARYRFLLATAQDIGAPAVAVAHHQNDQAETLLERLVRGSGVKGLAAMSATRALSAGVTLLRPLLLWSREELEGWLREQQVTWHHDPSNDNLQRQRNRLRHQVLPGLENLLGQSLVPRLAATAEHLQQADAALDWMVDQLWPTLDVGLENRQVTLPHPALARLPDELIARILLRLRRLLLPAEVHPLTGAALQNLLRLIHQPRPPGRAEARGITLIRHEDRIFMVPGRQRL